MKRNLHLKNLTVKTLHVKIMTPFDMIQVKAIIFQYIYNVPICPIKNFFGHGLYIGNTIIFNLDW